MNGTSQGSGIRGQDTSRYAALQCSPDPRSPAPDPCVGTLVAQTQGSTTTRYVQDLAASLSQILSDGTNRYVYGPPAERLSAQPGSSAKTWYSTDALNSVRALLDDAGFPLAAASYDAWGVPETPAMAPFGFTGELQQGSDVWLRARWYGAGRGGFGARDAWVGDAQTPYSLQYYQYGYSNPTRWIDPSGASPLPPRQGAGDMTTAAMLAAITGARALYSKEAEGCFLPNSDDGQHDADGLRKLLHDYICEYGPDDRVFTATARLTKELAESLLIARLRDQYYRFGQDILPSQTHQMSVPEGIEAFLVDGLRQLSFITLTDFIGGLDGRRVTTDTSPDGSGHKTVRFEIYNRTTLRSGTRIAATAEGTQEVSFEEYLANPTLYNRDGSTTPNGALIDTTKFTLNSVLMNKLTRSSKNPWGLGGGNMSQRFIWEEPYDPCYLETWKPLYSPTLLQTEDYGNPFTTP